IIKTGSREEAKQAQKLAEEFWHKVYIPQRAKGRKAFSIFLDEIKKFDEIQDVAHQIYLISVLKWPLLAIGEEDFEEWAEFILKYIQHSSGKIRQAILHAADYLIMNIIIDLNIDDGKKISEAEKQRIKKSKDRFCHFTYIVESLLENYDEPRFRRYQYISSMPPSVYKSLQKLMVEVLLRNKYYEELYVDFLKGERSAQVSLGKETRQMKSRELEYVGDADDFEMSKWMECAWRCVPCGKDECKICGSIKRDLQKHIERGEDPYSIESALEDVGDTFREALTMIKKDAKRRGIDIDNIDDIKEPPRPEEFPLYKKAKKWRDTIFKIAEAEHQSHKGESLWLNTEEAADLFWYSSTLSAKTYRQLCNRWHIETGDGYGDFDYTYTKYVLKECLTILKKSLKDLSFLAPAKTGELISALAELNDLEKEILKI
ncbi:hypothetical protein MYX07_06840, partial [Patescibacteria group bacterium AH-259-L07]|nr:hypothetical protein [Patescibacteria group bacterium AH-259-L07]